ncbi:helix-turn-helix domain-containing protein [Mycolicibacterium sp. BiH015]|uniref:IclR family transcriptional regulator n=1 Tax=Mycolicibacterium sp. BiH015 TaxID=3018808 RepID=UPI0022E5F14E|nr:IclR family transcriptional regulator C-terminal domain-containing protein [Mycolicibacterium sp. BiH015]MDA2892196.1 helix-turn-helix domain-containing protein [Mycolicibacterium sp. BiH015]
MSGTRKSPKSPQPDLLRRPLLVLETLAAMEQPASLLAIASAVGLSKAGAYRVLRTLQDEGYVDHVGRRGYRVGSRSIALASLVGPRPALLERARPVLSRLAAMAQATATLHLRSGEHRVLVLGAEQGTNLQARRIHIGERSPLTSGCSGRVILAHLPTEEASAVLADYAIGRRRANLERELGAIRADGYALSFSENRPSFNGIGAALLDPDTGYPLGSIAIAGPDEQLPAGALRTFVRPLISACDGLAPHFSALLGPNSSARRQALDVTIQDLVAAARA